MNVSLYQPLMERPEREDVVARFIRAYNAFDVDGMVVLLHPDITFENIAGGVVNASTSGVEEFRALAEKSKELFSSRCQTITDITHEDESMVVAIRYEGILRVDLPNGWKAGQTLAMTGKSVYRFRGGLIHSLTDFS